MAQEPKELRAAVERWPSHPGVDPFFSVYYVHWYPRVYFRYADPSQQPFQDPRVLPQWAVDNYVNLVPGESRCC